MSANHTTNPHYDFTVRVFSDGKEWSVDVGPLSHPGIWDEPCFYPSIKDALLSAISHIEAAIDNTQLPWDGCSQCRSYSPNGCVPNVGMPDGTKVFWCDACIKAMQGGF